VPVLVTCSACSKSFRAPEKYAGKTAKCPLCKQLVKIAGPLVSPFDVFLSYSSKDKPTADAACAVLEARGLRCWIAPRDIIPGKEWGAAIVEGRTPYLEAAFEVVRAGEIRR
jgi:phage FluMu protein Com